MKLKIEQYHKDKMTRDRAKEIISKSFKNATLSQFKNQMEWLLSNKPVLEPYEAIDQWSREGVP